MTLKKIIISNDNYNNKIIKHIDTSFITFFKIMVIIFLTCFVIDWHIQQINNTSLNNIKGKFCCNKGIINTLYPNTSITIQNNNKLTTINNNGNDIILYCKYNKLIRFNYREQNISYEIFDIQNLYNSIKIGSYLTILFYIYTSISYITIALTNNYKYINIMLLFSLNYVITCILKALYIYDSCIDENYNRIEYTGWINIKNNTPFIYNCYLFNIYIGLLCLFIFGVNLNNNLL